MPLSSKSKGFIQHMSIVSIDHIISIVAVHGLNPKNTEFHAEKTWTSEKTQKLWLRDFLPAQLPSARIFIFGYNSNVAFETSSAGLSEHAGNLLNLVSLERKVCKALISRLRRSVVCDFFWIFETDISQDTPHRPLIFICHSLGGIVVKEVS
jgi:hypothetical protein